MNRTVSRWLAAALAVAFALIAAPGARADEPQRKPLAVGDTFPDFSGKTPDGKEIKLSDYKGKQAILVDFWATWCGPCRAELPNLKSTYGRFHEKGFEVVAISLDKDLAALKKFYDNPETTLPWPSIADGKGWEAALARRFGINSIPATYLLDKDLKIVETNLRGTGLRGNVAKLLGEPAEDDVRTLVRTWLNAEAPKKTEFEPRIIAASGRDFGDANETFWTVLSNSEPSKEFAVLAAKAMEKAVEAANGDAMLLDTAALAEYYAGNPAKAAEMQEKVLVGFEQMVKKANPQVAFDRYSHIDAQEMVIRLGLYLAASGKATEASDIFKKVAAAAEAEGEQRYATDRFYLAGMKIIGGQPAK